MLKKGFTLQELLITMAIIGIIAAIAVPSLFGMAPDETKSMYMKAFNTLSNITPEILDDKILYWTQYANDGVNVGQPNCSGLTCEDAPTEYPKCDDTWTCEKLTKFGSIFATKVNVVTKEKSGNNNDTVTFTTNDGIDWSMKTVSSADANLPGGKAYNIEVTINVKPDDAAHNCKFSENCKKPRIFTFKIDNDGEITPTDALGLVYSQNPIDMHSAKEDKELAEKIVGKDDMAKVLLEIKRKAVSKTDSSTNDTK